MSSDGFPYADETQPGNFAYKGPGPERTTMTAEPITAEALARLRQYVRKYDRDTPTMDMAEVRSILALIDQQAARIAELEAALAAGEGFVTYKVGEMGNG